MSRSTVGWSDKRTKAKHRYLNKILGREIGAAVHCARSLHISIRGIHWFDLTAGDGEPKYDGPWERSCSPGLFAYHAKWAKHQIPVQVTLCERAAATVGDLARILKKELPSLGYRQQDDLRWSACDGRVSLSAQCVDSREHDFADLGHGHFVFFNNDPNNVNDWALNSAGSRQVVSRGGIVRSFSTMGCNAGGLKRLPFEGGREKWFGYVEGLLESLRATQDVILMPIDGDDGQWGYAIVTPKAWGGDEIDDASRVFGEQGMTLDSASLRYEATKFWKLVDHLFLTAKERAG